MWLYESIVKNLKDYLAEETFEDYVERILSPFYGKSKREFEIFFDRQFYRTYDLLKSLFSIKEKKIEEFEKADVLMKTIRVERNGLVKESMSFKQIQFKNIIEEEWEDSVWFEELNRRFFL